MTTEEQPGRDDWRPWGPPDPDQGGPEPGAEQPSRQPVPDTAATAAGQDDARTQELPSWASGPAGPERSEGAGVGATPPH